MKRVALACTLMGLLGTSCQSLEPALEVKVSNELDLPRPMAVVELDWRELRFALVGLDDPAVFAAGTETLLPTQLIDEDGDGEPEALLFQAAFQAGEARSFVIRPAHGRKVPVPEARCFARFVPERQDDFAWENDLVAFRMYGPALAADPVDSGVDCWLKRVTYPIIDKWYRQNLEGISYHVDHGEGFDPYHVGSSRGCGGLAVWADGELHPSEVFASWKLIAAGPLRCVFELRYDPWTVGGRRIKEVKRISLDRGQRLARFESSFLVDGEPSELEVAVGLTTHDGRAVHALRPELGLAHCWEKLGDSELGTAILLPRESLRGLQLRASEQPDRSHALAVVTTDASGRISYHAGFGWSRAGEIRTARHWEQYLRLFSRRADSPLEIEILRP